MAKTNLQIQSFLSVNSYRSETDWEMIAAFCRDKAEFSILAEIDPENGITASEFIDWYEHGFGTGDVTEYDGRLVILGKTLRNASKIVAMLSDDKILISDLEIASEGLKMASEGDVRKFHDAMLREKLQFNWSDLRLIEKYIPKSNERVIWFGKGQKGLGVVRSVDLKTGEVELFCWFNYNTKQTGFSMHEKDVVNLRDFVFEPMELGENKFSKMNALSCQRRLNRELEHHGKTWNQPRHRVEPVNMQVEKGKRYWYISDKLALVSDIEKGLQTSRNRALAGNYFKTNVQGLEVLGRIMEVICDYLASPESNS